MPRCPFEEREILALFRDRLAGRPTAGFVVGTVEMPEANDAPVAVQMSHVGCDPVALVVAAHELLTAAGEAMLASPLAAEFPEMLARIEQAKATLDLTEPETWQ